MPRPTRSHRRHRRPSPLPAAGAPLRAPDDALRIVLAAIAEPPEPESIVLLLDGAHRGGTCLVCRGAATATEVAELVPLLIQAAATTGPILAAVVLATVRPDEDVVVAVEDRVAFRLMRADLAEAGIDLLDWFVLDGEVIASVAELTGADWHWSGEEPRW
jgi:hypothetical protein